MYLGIDLGSTNLKAALYDETMKLTAQASCPVEYMREGGFIEFEPKQYCRSLKAMVKQMLAEHPGAAVRQIAFTGQAESLVCLDAEGEPTYPIISWMDERSDEECRLLAEQFPEELCRQITGQQAVLPTWPATKILWLKENRPEVFSATATYMLLKDYVVYDLTGKQRADMSIATFSFYFDIYRKCYWQEMLQAIGITENQLPALIEPCTVVGQLTEEAAKAMGLDTDVAVNTGTLDHFAGMIGTGNTAPGSMNLSTGTTMVLATMVEGTPDPHCETAMHYGFLPNTYVMLPVMESGGCCLDWFRRTCMDNMGYDVLNRELPVCEDPATLLFLPYLVGTNAPEFDREATGMFCGLRQEHTALHMAKAVIEGVCFVLRKNCEDILSKGTTISCILATGGGAKSPVWCQSQADITGLPVVVPQETEAACLGAALIAACGDGKFTDLSEAAKRCTAVKERYEPRPSAQLERKYRMFCKLYDAALEIAKSES